MPTLDNISEVITVYVTDIPSNVTSSSVPGDATCGYFRIWFYVGVLGIVCLLGVIGNTVSFVVLRLDRDGYSPTILLLQALAIADNSVLIISFIILSLVWGLLPFVADRQTVELAQSYTKKYGEPFAFMSHTTTIWTTVLLAFHRYIAICHPFRVKSLCSKSKTIIQIIVVFAFSLIYNFPRFFQYYITTDYDADLGRMKSVFKQTAIGPATTFGVVYTNAIYSLVVVMLPLIVLCILNTRLIHEIRTMRKREGAHGFNQLHEEKMTTVLVIIIISLVVCHLPDRILQALQGLWMSPLRKYTCTVYCIIGLCNLLVLLNSSTNFIIYYVMRPGFRRILRKRLWKRVTSGEGTSSTWTTQDKGPITSVSQVDSDYGPHNALLQRNAESGV